jgi:predicted ATPase
LQLTWKDRDFASPFDISQLSEGTVRFLWLAALLLSPDLPAITLLDEPELSLHPELLALLANLLRDAATRTNLVVATHSDRLIRFLNPAEILICDSLPDGGASFTWGDDLNLEKWLQDYSLDELWSMNVLGGRAQP